MLDFVAEQGAEKDGWAMTAPGGSYFVIGYGGTLTIPTLDIISTERNIVGNIVGTYNELAELMVLAQAGKVTLHTKTYPLDAAPDALPISTPAGCAAARSSSPKPRSAQATDSRILLKEENHGQGTAIRREARACCCRGSTSSQKR